MASIGSHFNPVYLPGEFINPFRVGEGGNPASELLPLSHVLLSSSVHWPPGGGRHLLQSAHVPLDFLQVLADGAVSSHLGREVSNTSCESYHMRFETRESLVNLSATNTPHLFILFFFQNKIYQEKIFLYIGTSYVKITLPNNGNNLLFDGNKD